MLLLSNVDTVFRAISHFSLCVSPVEPEGVSNSVTHVLAWTNILWHFLQQSCENVN